MLPVDQMMKLVEQSIHDPRPELRGDVVLLHDSGGDRSQTIKLLPVLIDRLRAEGYSFVPVSELGGFSRDQVMPKLPWTVMLSADRAVFSPSPSSASSSITVLSPPSSWASAALWCWAGWRSKIVCATASSRPPSPMTAPTVSVLIPAYNEEKVIAISVERILASDYRNLEILVIDDGSLDRTADVSASVSADEKRVNLISIRQWRQGACAECRLHQASGDGRGGAGCRHPVQRRHDFAAGALVRRSAVGAVAGNAKVGNRINMITRWQALEYIMAQNLERRALAALDTLTVVPGAVGAWRRETLAGAGRLSRRHPGRRPGPDHRDPERGLSGGVRHLGDRLDRGPRHLPRPPKPALPLVVRHLAMSVEISPRTFNPRFGELGFVALPQIWLFQIILTTLAPLADLLLVWQLAGNGSPIPSMARNFTDTT